MKTFISRLTALVLISLMAACATAPSPSISRMYTPPPGEEWVPREHAETIEEVVEATVNEGWQRVHEVSYTWYTSANEVFFSDCKSKMKGLGSKFGTLPFERCTPAFFYSGVSVEATDENGEPMTYVLEPPSFECIGHQPFVKERRYQGGITVRTYFPTGGRRYTVHCTAVND